MKVKKLYENEQFINACLTCVTDKQIAEVTGVSISTVSRYKHDPDFLAILQERRTEYVKDAVSNMQYNLGVAVNELVDIIKNPKTKDQIKVNAIQILLSQSRSWIDVVDTMNRIEIIENELKRLDIDVLEGVIY